MFEHYKLSNKIGFYICKGIAGIGYVGILIVFSVHMFVETFTKPKHSALKAYRKTLHNLHKFIFN
jgi:hypothetical protein